MITRIRDVRRAAGLTLADVAERCDPPTTPQTIGRLETGTRTVSVGWLNRIAGALGVEAGDLVTLPDSTDLPVAALLGARGPVAPRKPRTALPPRPAPGALAILVEASQGDYRAGDTIWLDRLAPERFAEARNRDALVPLAAGRFAFGRIAAIDDAAIELVPATGKPHRIPAPAWIAMATRLVRTLG